VTSAERQYLRELVTKASPGPWTVVPEFHDAEHALHINNYDDAQVALRASDGAVIEYFWYDGPHLIVGFDNNAFIAAARDAVPALLDDVERLRAALKDAIAIAWRRGRGEFPPTDSDRLVELDTLSKS
jgi:hypothetical protein